MSLRIAALQAYRRLLSTQRMSFAGDREMLFTAKAETRKHFRSKLQLKDPVPRSAAGSQARTRH
jgi:hypothetical protein